MRSIANIVFTEKKGNSCPKFLVPFGPKLGPPMSASPAPLALRSLLCCLKCGADENKMASVDFPRAPCRLAGSEPGLPPDRLLSNRGEHRGFRRAPAPAGGRRDSCPELLQQPNSTILPAVAGLGLWKDANTTNLNCSLTVCSNQYIRFLKKTKTINRSTFFNVILYLINNEDVS